ncbi:MAG: cell division protein SepF [Eggerthellaceae bacterium]|jgi:cell division inhibitor SepF|nr:cell division protein SepF [Eggerthellaceae bacterium]MDR2721519.1 cell division protein SepF [Coriobacteriaceae bacterium]
MELPRLGRVGEGFEALKSRLGFSSTEQTDDYDEEYYENPEDGYDEYGEFEDGYEEYAPSGARSTSYAGSAMTDGASPRLVSMDDARESSRYAERPGRDQYADQGADSGSDVGYRPTHSPRKIERASDYLRSGDTNDLAQASEGRSDQRSPGYNSLFSPTSGASSVGAPSSIRERVGGFDSQDIYDRNSGVAHSSMRTLSILKPVSYGEVERIAKIVRAGDVVVLSLHNTPEHLSKRLLDFTFGVSSALDATVDCIADKVFVISRGRPLSDEEFSSLRNQGVVA